MTILAVIAVMTTPVVVMIDPVMLVLPVARTSVIRATGITVIRRTIRIIATTDADAYARPIATTVATIARVPAVSSVTPVIRWHDIGW